MRLVRIGLLSLTILCIVACSPAADDFAAAARTGTVKAYEAFLEAHPEGKLAGKARAAICSLLFDEAAQRKTLPAFEESLARCPDGELAARATEEIQRLRTQLVFVSTRGDDSDSNDIFVMNEDGSERTKLTDDSSWVFDPTWSPDRGRIAFVSGRTGNQDIFVMAADGSNPVNLTDHPADDVAPAWSPDGEHIAFATSRDGNVEIFVMGADGSNPVNLTNHPDGDFTPAWSPDGRRVAFASVRYGTLEIMVMNRDGSGVTRLTDSPTFDWMPAWSPDGRHLAYVMAHLPAGTTQGQLWFTNTKLFHTTERGWASLKRLREFIGVMRADGTESRLLMEGPDESRNPRWAWDGSRIAFTSDRNGIHQVFAVNADGSDLRTLTPSDVASYGPDW